MSTNEFLTSASETEEFDFGQLLQILLRRWSYILSGVIIGGLIAYLHTARTKPTWQGTFQIVLSDPSQAGFSGISSSISFNPLAQLSNFGSGRAKNSELETEVQILSSPSVLKPVFDKFISNRNSLDVKRNQYQFHSWLNSLSINLQKGTSILTISYVDTDKSSIIPVLNEISTTYQSYSGKERNESIDRAIQYVKSQAEIYRTRSDASYRELNSFGLTYGISSTSQGAGGGSQIDIQSLTNSSSGKPISSLSSSGQSRNQRIGDPLGKLAQLNQDLIKLQQTFTPNDPSIIALTQERDALRQYIETSAVGSLAYPGKQALTKEQAQSILIRHEELDRKASRDQATLDSMESALLSLRLEKARSTRPWQLISTPTVVDQPISPRPMYNIAVGLAAGLIFGAGAAVLVDKASRKVFNIEVLLKNLPFPLIADLSTVDSDQSSDLLKLLTTYKFTTSNLAIAPIGKVRASTFDKFRRSLSALGIEKLKFCDKISDATGYDSLLLIAEYGGTSTDDIPFLVSKLTLLDNINIGWVWLNKNSFEG